MEFFSIAKNIIHNEDNAMRELANVFEWQCGFHSIPRDENGPKCEISWPGRSCCQPLLRQFHLLRHRSNAEQRRCDMVSIEMRWLRNYSSRGRSRADPELSLPGRKVQKLQGYDPSMPVGGRDWYRPLNRKCSLVFIASAAPHRDCLYVDPIRARGIRCRSRPVARRTDHPTLCSWIGMVGVRFGSGFHHWLDWGYAFGRLGFPFYCDVIPARDASQRPRWRRHQAFWRVRRLDRLASTSDPFGVGFTDRSFRRDPQWTSFAD